MCVCGGGGGTREGNAVKKNVDLLTWLYFLSPPLRESSKGKKKIKKENNSSSNSSLVSRLGCNSIIGDGLFGLTSIFPRFSFLFLSLIIKVVNLIATGPPPLHQRLKIDPRRSMRRLIAFYFGKQKKRFEKKRKKTFSFVFTH